ncbi:hypothetical protein M8J76_007091 [Diaphorina citri]|nr:hypothetical protein M8J76_007091 [Diaphorina citri]
MTQTEVVSLGFQLNGPWFTPNFGLDSSENFTPKSPNTKLIGKAKRKTHNQNKTSRRFVLELTTEYRTSEQRSVNFAEVQKLSNNRIPKTTSGDRYSWGQLEFFEEHKMSMDITIQLKQGLLVFTGVHPTPVSVRAPAFSLDI